MYILYSFLIGITYRLLTWHHLIFDITHSIYKCSINVCNMKLNRLWLLSCQFLDNSVRRVATTHWFTVLFIQALCISFSRTSCTNFTALLWVLTIQVRSAPLTLSHCYELTVFIFWISDTEILCKIYELLVSTSLIPASPFTDEPTSRYWRGLEAYGR